MILRDLIQDKKDIIIEFRTNSPVEEEKDMLFGYAKWTGEELESLDGDDYYLDEELYRAEIFNDSITVWFKSDWIRD